MIGSDLLCREAVVDLRHGARDGLADGAVAAGRERLQPHADGVGSPLIDELRDRRDGFELDLVFGALQHRQQVLDALLVADFADGPHHRGERFGLTLQHLDEPRQRLRAADLRERIHRTLAHPPVAVPGRLDQLGDRALVLGLIQNLDRCPANVLILVLDEGENGVHHLRAADLAERVRRPRAHPPIAVGNHLEQVLDVLGAADDVQNLDRGAPRILVLVLEHFDQVLDGVRMIGLDHHVDGLVLHLDLCVAQHAGDQRHVERSVHARERRQGGGADQLVVVLELLLHRLLDRRGIEAGEDLDDVQARHRVLALDARDQIVDGGFVGDLADDLEQRRPLGRLLRIGGVQQVAHRESGLLRGDHIENRGFWHALLAQGIEERLRRVAAARGQRPGDARGRPPVGVCHGLENLRQRSGVNQLRKDLDVGHGLALLGVGQRIDDRIDGARPKREQLLQGLLGRRGSRIAGRLDLGDEPIGTVVGEQ